MGARDPLSDATTVSGVNGDSRMFDLSTRDFDRIRRIIFELAGIDLGASKRNMVYSRLSRRLRALGIDSFAHYLDQLEGDPQFTAQERQEFVNALTTNLTSFFREKHHFPVFSDFLMRGLAGRPARIWCAAASTGEEPYSIAMTAIEALGANSDARILATDIDTQVLACAGSGVYRDEAVQVCGPQRMRRFFLRGTGANAGMVRVRPEVARLVEFALAAADALRSAAGRGVLPQRDDLLQPRHPARRDGAVRIGSQARRPAVRGSLGELHRLPRVVRAAWQDRVREAVT